MKSENGTSITELGEAEHLRASRNGLWLQKPALGWAGIVLLSGVGLLSLGPCMATLWHIWVVDPLSSIGSFLFVASILLIARAWREMGWELDGTWWGLVPLVLALFWNVAVVQNISLKFIDGFSISLLPLSLSPLLYGIGIVLLFGGVRVLRHAWFPLLLLLLLNPVPNIFIQVIDLPLQHVAADVARSFALAIGFAPTTPQLLLMFSPSFGMFIAPGCDGVRGAVTMGYLVLIAGYVLRLKPLRWALYTVGAVLIGYTLNFLRLCALVVYYRVVDGHPALEARAHAADYVIGACIILIVSYLGFLLLLRTQRGAPVLPAHPWSASGGDRIRTLQKLVVFAVAMVLPIALFARALTTVAIAPPSTADLLQRLPHRVGEYVLLRTWPESLDGITVMVAGAYTKPGVPGEVDLGVWIASTQHETTDCWRLRGETAELYSTPVVPSANGRPISFTSSFMTDNATDTTIWNVLCTPESCSQAMTIGNTNARIRIFHNDANQFSFGRQHTVPLLIKTEQADNGAAAAQTYSEMSAKMADFVSGLDPMRLSQNFQ